MKTNYAMSITIRIGCDMYEQIEELKWSERMKQSDLLRELLQAGIKVKTNQRITTEKNMKLEEMNNGL